MQIQTCSQPAARMAFTLFIALFALAQTAASQESATARQTGGLGRSLAKLKADKALAIGYFGGSITAGAGASNAAKTSWRALTTAWFKEHFPEANITEINAAIGGTGSDLGAFRCQQDLLDKHPDLVFVEFAVNDGGGPEQRIKRSMEGIVRQIWRANPSTDIIFLYTTTRALAPPYDKGELPKAVTYDHAVAAHYGISEINVGKTLVDRLAAGAGTWETLTTDGVHPSDVGYAVCMETIKVFLESHLADALAPPVTMLPEPLTKDPLEHGHFVDAASLQVPGWTTENKSLAGRYPHYIATDKPGTELVARFSGTAVGVFWLIAPDSGDIEWSIDGGKPARRSSWDKYALRYSRPNYAILADDLSPGEHTLKITVLAEKNEQSKGTWIRIGALLVN